MVSIFHEENRLVFQKFKASNYIKNDRSLKKNTFCFMTGGETTSAWSTFRPDHKWTHLGHNSRYLRQKEREESHGV